MRQAITVFGGWYKESACLNAWNTGPVTAVPDTGYQFTGWSDGSLYSVKFKGN